MDEREQLQDPRRLIAIVRVAVRAQLSVWGTRRIGDEEEEDLVNTILVSFCEDPEVLERFDPERATLTSYMRMLVRRRMTELARKHARRAELDRTILPALPLAQPDAPDAVVSSREAGEHVARTVALKASPGDREIFAQAFVEGSSTSEIARELGIPKKKVGVRIFALRTRLTRWLAEVQVHVPRRKT